ncbi:MAG TPA: cation:dicarboxylase symporter family transporter [Candidatus Methylomirabilis sp.]|nr:cation:dicarboxylase symporter family transporter [Candidatus Methylomirabilis sp.]
MLLIMRWLVLLTLVAYAGFRRSLTAWIFVAMLVGAEIGHDLPSVATHLRVLAMIFLRLIKTIIAPLLFATLVVGIAGHSNLRQVGRLGLRSIIYFEVVTTAALAIGLAAINVAKPGVGVALPSLTASETGSIAKLSAEETILHAFPENIAKAVADNAVLQVVVFSLIFAIALAMIGEDKRRPMLAFCESLAATMFKFTNIVMLFAPIGVGAAVAYTVANSGVAILGSLVRLLATYYAALFIFILGVLLPIARLFGVPVRGFSRAVAEPVTIAFATTSSEAALPRAMEAMEGFGVPRQIVAFVIPTGYSFNMDGGSLYLSAAAIFVAQVAGIHLSLGQQLTIMLTLMLTSKGIAGVSRGSFVVLMATAASLGLPSAPLFLLLGVDPLLDMGRTAVNVLGNCLASVVMAKWEGEFEDTPAADLEVAAVSQ